MSEWLDLLIEEVDRKERELEEAREEARRRTPADTAPDTRHGPGSDDKPDDYADSSK